MDDLLHKQRDTDVKIAIEIAIKLGVLAFILTVSFLIIQPFLALILWSVILAVALSPFVHWIVDHFSLTKKTVLILLMFLTAVVLATLIYMFWDKAFESLSALSSVVKEGSFSIPPPNEHVKEWPIVGPSVYEFWENGSKNIAQTLLPFKESIRSVADTLIAALGGALKMMIISVIAIIIAAFILKDEALYATLYTNISKRLIGKKGEEWAHLSALTIRSVAMGIIGVAFLQAVAVLPALVIMKVPFAILIAVGVMFLTIIQLSPSIILLPVIAYVFSYAPTTSATIFAVYTLIIGSIDGILKPIFMARGVDIPMLVILIGAIGGMLLMGLIGLFLGAVIFALSYKLFNLWIAEVE